MQRNNAATAASSTQPSSGPLARTTARVRTWQACRESFLEITAPLNRGRADLTSRWAWDAIASDVNGETSRLRNAFAPVFLAQDAFRAAQGQGPDALAATRAKVRAFFNAMEAEASRGFEEELPVCRVAAVAKAVNETCEATIAMTTFAAVPTTANESKARREVSEAIGALMSMLRAIARRMWRQPMSA